MNETQEWKWLVLEDEALGAVMVQSSHVPPFWARVMRKGSCWVPFRPVVELDNSPL